jgi:hypothetical protein
MKSYFTKKIIHHFKCKIKNIIRGIKNLWYWFPVVWKDSPCESENTYDFLLYKLKSIYTAHLEHGGFSLSDNRLKWMRVTVKLLERITVDHYELEYTNYYKTDSILKGNVESYKVRYNDLKTYFDKYPTTYNKALVAIRKNYNNSKFKPTDLTIAVQMGIIRKHKAMKIIHKLLSKNLLRWWH